MSDVPIPDVVAPFRGVRCWKAGVFMDGPRLVSPNRGEHWPVDRLLEAVCGVGCVHAPCRPVHVSTVRTNGGIFKVSTSGHDGYGCGIYALTHEAAAESTMGHHENIVGEVELWGEVYPYEKGYRAQYARPAAIYRTGRNDEREDRIAAAYGIPVVPLPDGMQPGPPEPIPYTIMTWGSRTVTGPSTVTWSTPPVMTVTVAPPPPPSRHREIVCHLLTLVLACLAVIASQATSTSHPALRCAMAFVWGVIGGMAAVSLVRELRGSRS